MPVKEHRSVLPKRGRNEPSNVAFILGVVVVVVVVGLVLKRKIRRMNFVTKPPNIPYG